MKNSISIDLKGIYHVLNFIEENYDQAISIEELEALSHYSYRNIQRIFKYTCDETIGAYQKRLRVENAYKMLLYTNNNISSIALKVGFANLASFSKAFKQHFHISPKEAKLQKAPLFASAQIFPVKAAQFLKPEMVYVPPSKVYYKSAFINYVHEAIEKQWDEFMQFAFPERDATFYGVVADEPLIRENLRCRYDTCCSMQSETRKLSSKTIGGGRYVQFTHYGTYETIEETYAQIYSGWILTTKLEFGHTPVIEKYVKHPGNTSAVAEQLTYIWLPLA